MIPAGETFPLDASGLAIFASRIAVDVVGISFIPLLVFLLLLVFGVLMMFEAETVAIAWEGDDDGVAFVEADDDCIITIFVLCLERDSDD